MIASSSTAQLFWSVGYLPFFRLYALARSLASGTLRYSTSDTTVVPATINSRLIRFYRGPVSITERRVPELILVLGSQPAGDVSHKPGGRLPLLSARPAVTGQRRDCDLNPGLLRLNPAR